MPWGSGKGSRLPARHAGSRKVVTAFLLGVAANTPGCRLDGGVEAEKGVCVTERRKMARAGKTTNYEQPLFRGSLWLGLCGNQGVAQC